MIELEGQTFRQEEFLIQQDKQIETLKSEHHNLTVRLSQPSPNPIQPRKVISMLDEITHNMSQLEKQVHSTQNRL